jgi:NADH:ubiquinone oxidoreductase subunit 6 (subunit J)
MIPFVAAEIARGLLVGALVFALVTMFAPLATNVRTSLRMGDVTAVAAQLLGRYLPQFEVAGLVLLVALVAVVASMGGDEQ